MADATKPAKPEVAPAETISNVLSDLTTPKAKVVDPAQERRDEIEAAVSGEFVNFTQNLGKTLAGPLGGDFEVITDEPQLAKALTALKSARSAVLKAVRGIEDSNLV